MTTYTFDARNLAVLAHKNGEGNCSLDSGFFSHQR